MEVKRGHSTVFVELDKKLGDLEKKVKYLERYFSDMQERAADLEILAEAVTKNAKKEKDFSNLTDAMVGHGEHSVCLLHYIFGLLHVIRKCVIEEYEEFDEIKTVTDMKVCSKEPNFKEAVMRSFPAIGLIGSDMATFLCILDICTQDKILTSEPGIFARVQANSELSPLHTLGSQDDLREGEKEVRDLFKFIAGRKLDKKTRSSLRRFVAAGQCSRTHRAVKDFPDPFLVKDILGFK